ncbi:lipoprotein [Sphaerisporangium krabiense]|uniref:Uncharacterized protein (DUF305 family) n=1 Tax=Sphaerisporangium krabiense TaxID=763782 RepID=A0A7W8ZA30_9ACTN|nr:DUF305 domain-containing protein [Sphaerisporangium krabiense]MBB5629848.1 uncharacterized protein (DUF305 family) [Sphaerisporangium krabiense]GII63949.1 lipoprotein [Sphaerisporangium krabiense]
MRAVSLIAVTAVALAVAGCSGGPAPVPTSTAPVIAPGRPGEAARTLGPSEALTAVPSPTAGAADVLFMQNMIIHHRQALDMSTGAAARAGSDQVKRLAARITATQGPEIRAMTRWLLDQGQSVPDARTAHPGMPGMATPEQLAELRAASGADFDRLYLRLMIAHHMGALTMVSDVLAKGSHVQVQEMAEDISVSQTAEVNRMRRLQAAEGG